MILGPKNAPTNRLGRTLATLRAKHEWTLTHVQDEYGVDKGNLSRIERGEASPSLETLHRLRDAYAVDDETFLTWLEMLRHRDQAGAA